MPGAASFLHCLKELVYKSQGGIVQERFKVVWKRGKSCQCRILSLRRAGESTDSLEDINHLNLSVIELYKHMEAFEALEAPGICGSFC